MRLASTGTTAKMVLVAAAVIAVSASAQTRRPRRERPEGAVRMAVTRPAGTQPASNPSSSQPTTTAPKLVPISFNNAPLTEIAKFLTEQFGKPVIIADKVKSKTLTLTNPKPLPQAEAMYVLTTALQDAGVAIEEREHTVHLIDIAEVVQAQIRTLGPEVDLSGIEPTNQIVRKMFTLRYYDAARLMDVLKPLLPSWSLITVEASGKLIVVSTVDRLRMVASIISQLDAPDVSGGELRVFPVKNVDVSEILPLLERLVSGYLGTEVKAVSTSGAQPQGRSEGGMSRNERMRMMMEGGGSSDMGSPQPGGGPISVKPSKSPVLLIHDPRRSAIVVVAPTNVLLQIEGWLKYLDQPQPPKTQTELVEVKYGDAAEITQQLQSMLQNMPDEALKNAIRLFPFGASRRIMIVGPESSRAIVKTWLGEIDVPDAGVRVTQTFDLKNADAQQVADNIKELFQDTSGRRYYPWDYDYGGRGRGGEDRTKVQVTANTRNNSVTVVASPERMIRIGEQIKEWDKPMAGEEAAPRIYDLKYADPDKTKTLLESLFTKKESNTNWRPWWDEEMPTAQSPVGRLFGQFRFEAYPDTGKLVVVSKNEENYAVIERMIKEIDSPQTGGLPRIIQLKFADAETLAEQLNALLNAPGTPASILRRGQTGTFKELEDKGSPYARDQSGNNNQARNQQQANQQGRGANTGEIQFWWQNPPSDLIKNRQPSNLVGKLRIVPNVEQNLLLVVAPQEFADAIEQFVTELDRPGQQVLIKAVIAEITHDDTTSLGYRFSSNPTAFGVNADAALTDNALNGLLTYNFQDFFGHQNQVTFKLDINNLLSLLRQVTNLKIRSEPKVFTADNVEAEFFDGQDIPFITDSTISGVTAGQTQSFDYRPVGIRLRVRPHITKERNIDLTVNLLVSKISTERIFGFAVVDRRETTTRIVLQDGHTFMISGILREEESKVNTGIPGLQDIPGLGEIFKHHQVVKVNSEVIILLTPYVIGPQDPHTPIEEEPLQRVHEQFDMAHCETVFSPPPAAHTQPAPEMMP